MKRKIIVALLTVFLCFMTCSCAKNLSLYKVYVVSDTSHNFDLDTGDIKYNKAENTYKVPSQKSSVKKGMPDKELQLGDETISLSYERTYNKEYCEYSVDSYSTNDSEIKANFRTDDGCLDYLRLGNYNYRIYDKLIENESELIKVCTDYLMTYVDDRIDYYKSDITTKIKTVDEHGVDNDSVNGYINASVYADSSVSYQVDFTYYIGEIKTGDIISIRIDSDGYLKTLSFNMTGAFDSFTGRDIDLNLCDKLIASEMSKLCDVDGHQYSGYTDQKIFIVLNNKLCLLSYAQPVYKSTDDMGDFYAMPIQLIIPVSK